MGSVKKVMSFKVSMVVSRTNKGTKPDDKTSDHNDVLVDKATKALKQTGHKHLVVSGGVAANDAIRLALKKTAADLHATIYVPRPAYCTDNGAMIAYLGWRRLQQAQQSMGYGIFPRARWGIDQAHQ